MQGKKIDRNIFTRLVSLVTDISNQMIYPMLPIFLSSILGVEIVFIGLLKVQDERRKNEEERSYR